MEPFFIRQTAEPMSQVERRDWFGWCAVEARKAGAKLCRAHIHPDNEDLLLFEAWDAVAADVGDPGDPRWQLKA